MKSLKELMSLKDRVAVVTGGTGHIGLAMNEALAELGAHIVVVDRDEKATSEMASNLSKKFGVDCLSLPMDLASHESIQLIPQKIQKAFKRTDILINCAAFVGTSNLSGWVVPFAEQSATTFSSALNLNLTAPFLLAQALAPALKESGHGSIINVSSIYGMLGPDLRLYDDTPMGNPAAYGASKGGLIQLTRWLATVLAPHIRVNTLTPGGVFRNQPEAFVKRYTEKTPLKRMGCEEDFKGATAFLASDLSNYVTGQNIVVDGGWTSW